MPELPEVQTTVDQLARSVCGRMITAAWMDPKKPVQTGSATAWPTIRRHIIGRRITSVTRRAKYIVIHLDNGARLWVHQKMTGHLLAGSWIRQKGQWTSRVSGPLADDPMNRYIRMILTLDRGQIGLSDARRFARIILVRPDEHPGHIKELAALGPEPLVLSPAKWLDLFRRKHGRIKPVLMDPAFVAGIGNIYADEILHRSGIHPFRQVQTISRGELATIRRHMRTVLAAAIRAGGSSTDDYRAPDGTRGSYQNKHLAYQRTGMRCTLCKKGMIERAVSNGRSSHFCSAHQR